jgi:hypothetical protein
VLTSRNPVATLLLVRDCVLMCAQRLLKKAFVKEYNADQEGQLNVTYYDKKGKLTDKATNSYSMMNPAFHPHKMVRITILQDTFCDRCGAGYRKKDKTLILTCMECDYDLCYQCAPYATSEDYKPITPKKR